MVATELRQFLARLADLFFGLPGEKRPDDRAQRVELLGDRLRFRRLELGALEHLDRDARVGLFLERTRRLDQLAADLPAGESLLIIELERPTQPFELDTQVPRARHRFFQLQPDDRSSRFGPRLEAMGDRQRHHQFEARDLDLRLTVRFRRPPRRGDDLIRLEPGEQGGDEVAAMRIGEFRPGRAAGVGDEGSQGKPPFLAIDGRRTRIGIFQGVRRQRDEDDPLRLSLPRKDIGVDVDGAGVAILGNANRVANLLRVRPLHGGNTAPEEAEQKHAEDEAPHERKGCSIHRSRHSRIPQFRTLTMPASISAPDLSEDGRRGPDPSHRSESGDQRPGWSPAQPSRFAGERMEPSIPVARARRGTHWRPTGAGRERVITAGTTLSAGLRGIQRGPSPPKGPPGAILARFGPAKMIVEICGGNCENPGECLETREGVFGRQKFPRGSESAPPSFPSRLLAGSSPKLTGQFNAARAGQA